MAAVSLSSRSLAGRNVLFAGDGHSEVLINGIKRLLPGGSGLLSLDAFKMPHHGSKANISHELLKKVDCGRYLFSTNGAYFKHPDKEAVARVIKYSGTKPELIFNYETGHNNIWNSSELMSKHNYTVQYPESGNQGVKIDI